MQLQKKKTNIGKIHNLKNEAVKQRATKRLMRDLLQIQKNPIQGISALPIENPSNIFIWHANIQGPKGTPWEKGIFHMVLRFPMEYPDVPPTIILSSTVHHECVQENRVCLDMLDKKK